MHWSGILLAFATASAAEAEEFCTDRPGLATGSCVVPPGTIQVETSLASWASSKEGSSSSAEWSVGSSVLRIGTDPGGEIQLGWTPYVRLVEKSAGERFRHVGSGDAAVAYKQLLSSGGTIAAAVMPVIKVPLAPRPIGNRRIEGVVLFPVDMSLSDSVGLTITPEAGLNADSVGSGRHLALGIAGGPEFQLSERLAASANFRISRDRDPAGASSEVLAGLSAAWLAQPRLQLDAEVNAGLSHSGPDLQLLLGFSVRP